MSATATPKMQHTTKPKNGLTRKQQVFVDAFAGNIRVAAKVADLSYTYARQLLTKHHNVRKAIHDRQEIEIRPTRIATRQERQNFWTTVMLNENVDYKDRLRASELLGRSEADFTENMSHTFPEGCGVLAVGKPLAHDDFAKEAAEHYKNGKNGNNGKNGKNPNDGDDSGRGDSGGVVRG